MILSTFSVVGLVGLFVIAIALLSSASFRPPAVRLQAPRSWKSYRFGFAAVSLIFLAFDMEMIFMYPWAVVFAKIGLTAFLDMLVFVALLSAGIAYAWGMGALQWE